MLMVVTRYEFYSKCDGQHVLTFRNESPRHLARLSSRMWDGFYYDEVTKLIYYLENIFGISVRRYRIHNGKIEPFLLSHVRRQDVNTHDLIHLRDCEVVVRVTD